MLPIASEAAKAWSSQSRWSLCEWKEQAQLDSEAQAGANENSLEAPALPVASDPSSRSTAHTQSWVRPAEREVRGEEALQVTGTAPHHPGDTAEHAQELPNTHCSTYTYQIARDPSLWSSHAETWNFVEIIQPNQGGTLQSHQELTFDNWVPVHSFVFNLQLRQ